MSTPLHLLPWQRSAAGRSIRARYAGLHISLWRRTQGGPINFTIRGTLPAESVTSTREAMAYVWERLLRHLGERRAA